MSFLKSPGVLVREIDLTTIVPSVPTSIGAIAGAFEKGPVGSIVTVGTEDDLVKILSDKLAAFKIPALIKFMDSNLPLVASGKFDKPALREIFTQE